MEGRVFVRGQSGTLCAHAREPPGTGGRVAYARPRRGRARRGHREVRGARKLPRRASAARVPHVIDAVELTKRYGNSVAAANRHRRAFSQTGLTGGAGGDGSQDGGRWQRLRKFPGVQSRQVDDLLRPAEGVEVEGIGSGSVGVIRGHPPGKTAVDVILGAEGFVSAGVDLRLMVADPHQLFQGVRGADAVAGDAVEAFQIDLGEHLRGLHGSSLIAVKDRGTQRIPFPVHRGAAHHLPAQRHHGHLRWIGPGFDQQLSRGAADGAPPVSRVLFGPVTVEEAGVIGACAAGHQTAIRGVQRGLIAAGAQVMG